MSKCSPDERSDIRESHIVVPGCRFADPGYGSTLALYLLALKKSRSSVAASLSPTAE